MLEQDSQAQSESGGDYEQRISNLEQQRSELVEEIVQVRERAQQMLAAKEDEARKLMRYQQYCQQTLSAADYDRIDELPKLNLTPHQDAL